MNSDPSSSHRSRFLPAGLFPSRFILVCFALGLALRWGLTLSGWATSSATIHDDAAEYQRLAENLWEAGVFSKSENPPFEPDFLRTPIYPLFLAPWTSSLQAGSPGPVFLLQGLLQMLFFAWFCGRLERWGAPTPAYITMAILSFEPAQVVAPNTLLTDLPFALLVWSGVLIFMGPERGRSPTPRRWFFAGLIWGVAALTRPIGVYLIIPLLAFGWFWLGRLRKTGTPSAAAPNPLRLCAILLLGFLLSLAPWLIRNYVHTGRLALSDIGSVNLYLYRAAGVEAARSGRPFDEVQEEFIQESNRSLDLMPERPLLRGPHYRELALPILLENPVALMRITAAGAARTMLGRSSPNFAEVWDIEFQGLRAGLSEREGPLDFLLFAITVADYLWVALLLALGFLGLLFVRRSPLSFPFLALSIIIAVYFIALSSGPESYARFRMPLSPAWAVLCALAVESLWPEKRAASPFHVHG